MGHKTPLYNKHVKSSAKIVDFGGWDMPVNYGSQIEEHNRVREDAGVFDVSHMTVVDIKGDQSREYLRRLLANDIDRLTEVGKALYSGMLDENGGIIDDLIVYNMDGWYRLIVNCGTREKDLAWLNKQAENFKVDIQERSELAMLAVQGPNAREKVCGIVGSDDAAVINSLSVFQGKSSATNTEVFYARTGYTGEDGLEIIIPNDQVENFWQQLLEANVAPIGLGARDTLRLEAGMNLYGSDMDENFTPLDSGMAWTLSWHDEDRNFIGKDALLKIKAEAKHQVQVGIVYEGRGVLRGHQKLFLADGGEGEISSGTFSPSLGYSVALARIDKTQASEAEVEMRGKRFPVTLVKPPFVRNGKQVFSK